MPRRSQAPRDEAADIERSGGRWRLRNWRLRTRLLVALLVPVVAMLAFAGFRVEANLSSAREYARAAERVQVDDRVAATVHELQRERDLTVRYVAGGRQGPAEDVMGQRQAVDDARGAFNRAFTAARSELSPEAVASFRQWDQRFGDLTDARYAGEHTQQPTGQILAAYDELIAGLLDIGDQAAVDTADRELARTYLAAGAVARVKDALSIRRALVAEALAAPGPNEERTRAIAGVDVQVDDSRREYAKFATEGQRRLLEDTLAPRVEETNPTASAVLDGNQGADPQAWDEQATGAVDAAKDVEDSLRGEIGERSEELASSTRTHALIDGAVILGVLLLAGLLAAAIARSLVRPLRTLRTSALDVAHYRLPEAVKGILADPDPKPEDTHRRSIEPVPVYSREELGQVARAFDAVHGQAVRLAGEQAMLRENVNSMFVNLSRRSQDLVERQLTVLDRMEEHEQDPDVLGGLFELDHLATRMRRNSENLLVLAGQDVGRPLPGAVAAEEIVGAALSEVEHYQRINVAATPQIGVRGDIVGDLVHVISELFENATDYSPADAPVSVVSAVTQDGEWRIDITDRGAGMPETEIRRANARLAEVPDVDVEVSRRMGLYVVARLARQHDIRVWLSSAELVGLTATVVVPAALIARADELSSESPVALEDAGDQRQQAQPVVFGPAEVARARTALPSEPEQSEPLAPADEPEPSEPLPGPVRAQPAPAPAPEPEPEPAPIRAEPESEPEPEHEHEHEPMLSEVEETPMGPPVRTESDERATEEIPLPTRRPPRLRPALPQQDEPRTEELPRIVGAQHELPPEPEPADPEPEPEPEPVVDDAAPAEQRPSGGVRLDLEPVRPRPTREPEPDPAEQTDVSGWGPGPTWPMRDDDERSRSAAPPPPATPSAPPPPAATPPQAPPPATRPQQPVAQAHQQRPEPGHEPDHGVDRDGEVDAEAPTRRTEAYEELVSRWFDPDTNGRGDPGGRNDSSGRTDMGAWNGTPQPAPANGAAPPNSASANTPPPNSAAPADSAPDGAGRGGPNGDPTSIDRSPEAIRRRMAGLQQGTHEGRHARR
ncbi:hypothetical protein BJF85_14145 [Saccharomonospora sp. CUA-673]|uniref:sensor histidine kinase n=1 Tax=Saccharomonospora sp. CUA-673 TaxID=1904969 RepID=UPI0009661126|nr:nitrate- and nitrite sensing domain-containing protein [Saccharomonospora sp. CUA-673]OLT48011.1 hypothetical protein BJF85_14145 [Saccharomonospora sp. CUA-673]